MYPFKRVFDFSFSLTFLILLFPLLVIIYFSIKFFDKGQVFFIQKRIGQNGVIFSFIKFRSMPVGTINLPSDKLSSVNISRIGKFIRRTNLDELPQLFNILRGEMSFVGPRPALISQNSLILKRINNGSITCKPGLTGLAQINSYDYMSEDKKAEYDGVYYQTMNPFSDFLIIIKTFVYLLSPPPIY